MKCIEATKPTKSIEVGTVNRVDDKEANSRVSTGYWKYIPKSEYKKTLNIEKPEVKVEKTSK